MLHLFFHLLGVWLLLSQASGTVSPGFLDKVIKVCGRDLVRIKIDICGKILLGDMTTGQEKQRILGSGQSAGESLHHHPNPAIPYFSLVASHQQLIKMVAYAAGLAKSLTPELHGILPIRSAMSEQGRSPRRGDSVKILVTGALLSL